MIPNILSIAGSDPSGGAGIQADLKAFAAMGAHGMAAITALTAQNTRAVTGVRLVDPAFVAEQIDTVFDDVRVDAVKIGMLGDAAIIHTVADALERHRPPVVVLDPVMVAKSGARLLAAEAVAALRERLLPLATLATPNLPEAADLLVEPEAADRAAMERQAAALLALGAGAVLLKGGHLDGEESPDLLCTPTGMHWIDSPRVDTANTHGTGCSLAAAIAALLPRRPLPVAVREAKAWLVGALVASARLNVGRGHGPVHHFHALWAPA